MTRHFCNRLVQKCVLPMSTAQPSLTSPAVVLFHSAGNCEWGPPGGAYSTKMNYMNYSLAHFHTFSIKKENTNHG